MTKLKNGEDLLNTLMGELRKVGGALDAASGMRKHMASKFLTPARPDKPKPAKKKVPQMDAQLEAELRALGLEDDTEFLEFLAQSDMNEIMDMPTNSPPAEQMKNIPNLPGGI